MPYKIEGFFRTCQAAGPLTGSQGVVIPSANRANVVLHEDVADAILAGRFMSGRPTRSITCSRC
ncbi:MAG: hypothetical protein WDO24_11620 [Pseudomonadota bacterium]